MLIILRGFRCSLILKTGPAKGVPLEQSKKAAFVKEFFRKLTFWGAGAILRKSAPAASLTVQYPVQYSTVMVLKHCRFAYNPLCDKLALREPHRGS